MNTLFTQIAQTRTEAVLEILVLLLVAGIIGYVTAMLYTRSVYRRRILIIANARDQASLRSKTLEADVKDIMFRE